MTDRADFRCPVCGSPLGVTVLDRFGGCELFGCGTCDLQTWEPHVNPGPAWYDESSHYLAKSIVDWLGWYHGYGLRRVPAGTRHLLDVGCSDGRFVYAAAAKGIDAVGIDFAAAQVRLGNIRYGGERLRCVTLERYLEEGHPPADVVTLFEVIEHVEDPLGLLRLAASASRPGGLVIVSTPNHLGYPHPPKELDAPPHHLTRWSPRAVEGVARRAGLVDTHVEICPPEIAIKAFLLANIRLHLVTRLLRARARVATAASDGKGAGVRHADLRRLIRAKDLAADVAARALAPIVGRWFPGPSMVLTARVPETTP